MVAKIASAQIIGLRTDIIEIEVDLSKGLHSFSIVGLPDKSVEEAKDRISAAIKNSGFKSPQKGNKKVIVSLAPASVKKEGTNFDLGIAIGFLLANGDLKFKAEKKIFVGELALNGELRPIKGALLIAQKAKEKGFEEIYLPQVNAEEAALIKGIKVYGCQNLKELILHFSPPEGEEKIELAPQPETIWESSRPISLVDFEEVKGQSGAKRGLEIAAAGAHNVAMYGPPGTGKTLLAKAFASILPSFSFEEMLEATGIHSASGLLEDTLLKAPPFRSPHHTSSHVALVGGGAWPRPGEITLAHRGVLFMDEFPEFESRVLEALRQPLEDRVVSVSRAKGSMIFPASFILVAAMNPCPCGFRGVPGKECSCSMGQLQKYQRKLSGPIIDRLDIWLEVPLIKAESLSDKSPSGESSVKVRERVEKAREIQTERFKKDNKKIRTNSEMGLKEIKNYIEISPAVQKILNDSVDRLNLSARAYHRVLKLARTIADLAQSEKIEEPHILEALQYRPKISFN